MQAQLVNLAPTYRVLKKEVAMPMTLITVSIDSYFYYARNKKIAIQIYRVLHQKHMKNFKKKGCHFLYVFQVIITMKNAQQ